MIVQNNVTVPQARQGFVVSSLSSFSHLGFWEQIPHGKPINTASQFGWRYLSESKFSSACEIYGQDSVTNRTQHNPVSENDCAI